ncbi:MAG: A/G-specific adenine glycosylase [Phycisphaerae bacterium]|nr:A/G-specific adenine glycosylase [Phycisphaerae bacterium]
MQRSETSPFIPVRERPSPKARHVARSMSGRHRREDEVAFRRVIRSRLLRWYDTHKRDLPWRRRHTDAYAQLLAEFMLQQTQVITVIGYYERFLQRFPTINDLAAADLDEVLALWAGLGYYRRARHLHAAARTIVSAYGGRVPVHVEQLMTLPGIGRSTAGAIASVAYGVRAPVLDGNVARVVSRLLVVAEWATTAVVRSRLWAATVSLLPENRCGDFNQALMELGAVICTPRHPACSLCPLGSHCGAVSKGLTERIPVTPRRTAVRTMPLVVAAVACGSAVLLVQGPDTGLWAGLWALPSEPVADGESIGAARDRLAVRLGVSCQLNGTPDASISRLLTHRQVTFHVFRGQASGKPRMTELLGMPCRWVGPRQRARLGISRAHQAIIESVGRVLSAGGEG